MFEHKNIWLTRLSDPKGCGPYRYIVTNGATSWCAFRTLKGLKEFLKCSNLTPRLQDKSGRGDDTHANFKLTGYYFEQIGERDVDHFNKIRCDAERISYSNGSPVTWKYVHIDGGGCIAYHLNPNVKNRPTFERAEVTDNKGPVESRRKGR